MERMNDPIVGAGLKPSPTTVDDRLAADVFGLTYREFAEVKNTHYKWRVIAPAAVENLRKAHAELWSMEKLADYLHSDVQEARQSLKRYVMSEKVNQGNGSSERIFILFQEWLDRWEPDVRERKILARDLSRLLASQLQVAVESGENLEGVILGLEKDPGPSTGSGTGRPLREHGPQWKD